MSTPRSISEISIRRLTKELSFSEKPKQGPEARLAKVNPQLMELVFPTYLDDKDLGRLSTSCVTLYTQTAKAREKRAFSQYLQAAIFNDEKIISRILNSYPNFLLAKPKDYGIEKVTCQHTWLTYLTEGESVFSMAQKLGHVEGMLVMFEAAEKDKDKSRITEFKDMLIMKIPTEEENEALQNKYIEDLILPMIHALVADKTIQVSWVMNDETKLEETKIKNASEATLQKLQDLREALFKPRTMKNCIDVDQFLIAVYKAYQIHFNTFQNSQQKDAYSVWVIGLSQSLVGRNIAEGFCHAFGNCAASNINHCGSVSALHLADGRSFYRLQCGGSGQGSSFLCSATTGKAVGGSYWEEPNAINSITDDWLKCYIDARALACACFMQQVQHCRQTATKQS